MLRDAYLILEDCASERQFRANHTMLTVSYLIRIILPISRSNAKMTASPQRRRFVAAFRLKEAGLFSSGVTGNENCIQQM